MIEIFTNLHFAKNDHFISLPKNTRIRQDWVYFSLIKDVICLVWIALYVILFYIRAGGTHSLLMATRINLVHHVNLFTLNLVTFKFNIHWLGFIFDHTKSHIRLMWDWWITPVLMYILVCSTTPICQKFANKKVWYIWMSHHKLIKSMCLL